MNIQSLLHGFPARLLDDELVSGESIALGLAAFRYRGDTFYGSERV
jgi:hypothetical protein